jgi:hypothetical protein
MEKKKVTFTEAYRSMTCVSVKSKPNKGKMLSQQIYYILKGFKANEVEYEEA